MTNYIYNEISKLQSAINHKELNDAIEKTLLRLQEQGCAIVQGKLLNSSHAFFGKNCQIRLNISERDDRKTILWDLLHEFGHHLDKDQLGIENKCNKKEEIRREKTAWANADKEFLSYPELLEFKDSYIAFRSKCLASYEITDYISTI